MDLSRVLLCQGLAEWNSDKRSGTSTGSVTGADRLSIRNRQAQYPEQTGSVTGADRGLVTGFERHSKGCLGVRTAVEVILK